MAAYHPLNSLEISNQGKPICVKVIKDWKEKFPFHRSVRVLILADEQGNRIAGTVHNYLLADFMCLEVGEWYHISKFQVKPNPDIKKWTENNLHIFFEKETVAVWCGPKKDKEMTFYQSIKEITDFDVSLKMSIADIIGGVVSVDKKVETEVQIRGTNSKKWLSEMRFTVADHTGDQVKCVAFGDFADDLESFWIDRDVERCLFIALKYWDIKIHEVEGIDALEAILYGENTYSEMILDDRDKHIKAYRRRHKSVEVFKVTNIEDGYEEVIAQNQAAYARLMEEHDP